MTDFLSPDSVEPGSVQPVDLHEPAPRRSTRMKAFIAIIGVISLGAAGLGVMAIQGNDDAPLVPLGIGGAGNGGSKEAAMDSSIYRMAEYRYVLDGVLEDLGDEAPAYQLVAPNLSLSDVSEMAVALGIDSPAVALEQGGFEASDPDRTLQISGDASAWWLSVWNGPSYKEGSSSGSSGSSGGGVDGTVSVDPPVAEVGGDDIGTTVTTYPYLDCPPTQPTEPRDEPVGSGSSSSSSKESAPDAAALLDCSVVDPQPTDLPVPEEEYTQPEPPKDLPSENEALAIATDFIKTLGLFGEDDWVFEVMDYSTMSSGVSCAVSSDAPETEVCTEEVYEEIVMERSVVAHRLVDGHEVNGLDFYVQVGDLGVITSASGMLADLEYIAHYPLRSTTQAFEDLKAGNGGYYGDVALGAPEALSSEVCEGGPAVDCMAPNIACDGPCPEPEVIEITVTGVSLSAQVYYTADEAGKPVQYVVATYHFVGSFPDGSEWSTDVVAVTDEYIVDAPTPVATQEENPTEPQIGQTEPPHPTPGQPAAFDPEDDIAVGEVVSMYLNLNFHCGVSTERFDAQWWDADPAWPGEGGGSPNVEDTTGELVLKDEAHAYWTNGEGVEINFVPHPGEFTPLGCD